MIKRSLAIRILLVTLFCLVLPILIYLLFIFREEYDNDLKKNYFSLLERGNCRASEFRETYRARLVINDILIKTLGLGKIDLSLPNPKVNEQLKKLADRSRFDVLFYYSILPDGKIICTASSDEAMIGQDVSNSAYVKRAIEKGELGYLSYGGNINEKRFYVISIVKSETDHPVGIFGIGTSANEILERMLHSNLLNYTIHFSLLTEDEIVFASSDPSFDLIMLKHISPERLAEIRHGREIGSFITEEAHITFNPVKGLPGALEWEWQGMQRIGTKIPIEELNLTLLVFADEEAIFRRQYDSLFRFVFIFCVITAVTSWLTFSFTERMARPLKRLRWVMQRLGKGDYTTRFVEDRLGYEINEIGETLNEMIVDLLDHMEAVKNERVQKETLANELQIGRDIQLSILPQEMPVFPEVDLAAGTLPAKEVCGDYYDFYVRSDPEEPEKQKLALTIADAAGKGISACLYSLCLRSMLRSYFAEYEDVGKIARLANNLFYQDTEKSSMFVTAFLGVFDPETRQFDYLCAGHHPAILKRKDGTVERLSSGHMALGVMLLDELLYNTTKLFSGDLLVLYTDGVTEAMNLKNELYGEGRLIDILEQNANQAVPFIWNAIVSDIAHFSQGAHQHDDITLIVMRVL